MMGLTASLDGLQRTAPGTSGMREHGGKVDDSTADRVNWTFTQSTDVDKITEDRDFSVQDFTETARPRPRPTPEPEPEPLPEPEPEPEPETGMPMFTRNMHRARPCMRSYPILCSACKIGNQPGRVFSYWNRRYTSGFWGTQERKSSSARL